MQIAYVNIAFAQTTWHILCVIPRRSTTHPHLDMAGSWWVITVALSATHDQLSRRIYLHASRSAEESDEDESEEADEGNDYVQLRREDSSESDDSDSSETECSDSD